MPDERQGTPAGSSPAGVPPSQGPITLYGPPTPPTSSQPPVFVKADVHVLPSPISPEFIDVLEKYEPGAANRILQLTEREQGNRHKLSWGDVWNTRYGMTIGGLLLGMLIVFAFILAQGGNNVGAGALLGGPAIAGAIAFIGRGGIHIISGPGSKDKPE